MTVSRQCPLSKCFVQRRTSRTCSSMLTGAMTSTAVTAAVSRRSSTAAIERIGDIAVRIVDAPSTTRPSTNFAHANIGLEKLLFAFYSLLRFKTSISQLDAGFNVSYQMLRQRFEQFAGVLDAYSIGVISPVECNELYVTDRLKSRKRDFRSHSRTIS